MVSPYYAFNEDLTIRCRAPVIPETVYLIPVPK